MMVGEPRHRVDNKEMVVDTDCDDFPVESELAPGPPGVPGISYFNHFVLFTKNRYNSKHQYKKCSKRQVFESKYTLIAVHVNISNWII